MGLFGPIDNDSIGIMIEFPDPPLLQKNEKALMIITSGQHKLVLGYKILKFYLHFKKIVLEL